MPGNAGVRDGCHSMHQLSLPQSLNMLAAEGLSCSISHGWVQPAQLHGQPGWFGQRTRPVRPGQLIGPASLGGQAAWPAQLASQNAGFWVWH